MSASFHDDVFPAGLAFGAGCGALFQTEITSLASGSEIRNSRWRGGRRHYNLTIGPLRLVQMRRLSAFFEARAGRRFGFLYRDWLDHHTGGDLPSAQDEVLAPADKEGRYYQLVKTYPAPDNSQGEGITRRRIRTPQAETVQLMRDQTLLTLDQDYSIDPLSGIVRLTVPLASGQRLTAGFHFYIPVRFDTDRLEVEMVGSELARVQNLPLIELPSVEPLS